MQVENSAPPLLPPLDSQQINCSTDPHLLPYTIRPYHVDLVPQLLPLLQETLGNSGAVRKSAAFWHWKHEANPFGSSYGLVAWDDKTAKAAGLRVLMQWHFRAPNGNDYRAVRAVDTATHPDYQRLGIFSGLTRQAIAELTTDGVDCIFNTPNSKSLPGYLKMGWQIAARWPLYIRPLRPLRMAWRRLIRATPTAASEFHSFFGPAILPWADFAHQYGDAIPPLLTAWESDRPTVGLRTVRSLDYLNWRYGGHPHIRYGVFPMLNPHGTLQGFAILRPNYRFGWQETVLAELCLPIPEVSAGRALLTDLIAQLKSDYLIAHAAVGTAELALLWQHGFWPLPRQQMIFTVRSLQEKSTALTTAAAWDLSLGDLEIF